MGEYRSRTSAGCLLRCDDRPGLVAAVSAFLADAGANIVSLDQHSTEQSGGTFMQRTIFHLPGLTAARDALERDFAEQVAAKFDMDFRLTEASKPKRVAIMASKEDHCLLDLLWRNRRGEIDMSVVMVVSNHPELADQVRPFSVPFLHVPATKDTRAEAERRQLESVARQRRSGGAGSIHADPHAAVPGRGRLSDHQHPPLVPARIHRRRAVSASQGARRQARRRDRPLRDRGPRRGTRSSSRTWCGWITGRTVEDLARLGSDVERLVLSRAVLWHCEDRIIRYGNQTVIF